ncbi:hypothetical protein Lqui_2774 [Legionella quinlivanii]|uniref:Uncharacterized protein n=1 Tax=Legionella quinlivanii TaxID=45073 RepID=A0A0W0XL02_9GAMM|nr:hypothetical protein Lqui_2774 [Legionella quinlivanii]SEG02298.1 hypothetical protein SAMN02746093_01651 [Legionella quinlivanii DSM 21216]STY11397.1 Uncharacterised protein [Legionella quinlivanii]
MVLQSNIERSGFVDRSFRPVFNHLPTISTYLHNLARSDYPDAPTRHLYVTWLLQVIRGSYPSSLRNLASPGNQMFLPVTPT